VEYSGSKAVLGRWYVTGRLECGTKEETQALNGHSISTVRWVV